MPCLIRLLARLQDPRATAGATPAAIEQLPEIIINTSHIRQGDKTCPICLNEMSLGEPARVLRWANNTLHTTHYTLHTTHYTRTVSCILCTILYTLYTIHYTLYTIHYTLYAIYTVYYTLYAIHNTLHTTHYTLHTTHCILTTLQNPPYTTLHTIYLQPSLPFIHFTPCTHHKTHTKHQILTLHTIY
ncbi:hypothetical protein B484DRAFT_447063 [Ochromonadaceae sp. CCMP2298]|nr:hypothetical protein B484DRAFT_447063 [Ochromonadaceae sp. CCMP2298]